PPLLCGVLRDQALGDDRLGGCDGAGRLPVLAHGRGIGLAGRGGSEDLPVPGLRDLPPRGLPGPGPAAGGTVRPPREPGHRRPGRGRAGGDAQAMSAAAALPAPPPPKVNYLNVSYGVKSWLLTTDHKRIALLYMASITLMFALGGTFAALIRLELVTPPGDLF